MFIFYLFIGSGFLFTRSDMLYIYIYIYIYIYVYIYIYIYVYIFANSLIVMYVCLHVIVSTRIVTVNTIIRL